MSTSSVVFLKLLMLLIMNFIALKASIPPVKSVSSDKVEKSTFQERYARLAYTFNLIPLVMPSIILCSTLIPNLVSPGKAPLCTGDANDELRRLSLSFIASFVLVTAGAGIRLLCFKTLGDLFTFEVTIRSNHRLVDTGPYSIVRHPSYTGGIMKWAGNAILVLSRQNPAITCGWATSSLIVKLLIVLWTLWAIYVWYFLSSRALLEERNLRNHFAQTGLWNDYVKRVPYRYIPGIC